MAWSEKVQKTNLLLWRTNREFSSLSNCNIPPGRPYRGWKFYGLLGNLTIFLVFPPQVAKQLSLHHFTSHAFNVYSSFIWPIDNCHLKACTEAKSHLINLKPSFCDPCLCCLHWNALWRVVGCNVAHRLKNKSVFNLKGNGRAHLSRATAHAYHNYIAAHTLILILGILIKKNCWGLFMQRGLLWEVEKLC